MARTFRSQNLDVICLHHCLAIATRIKAIETICSRIPLGDFQFDIKLGGKTNG